MTISLGGTEAARIITSLAEVSNHPYSNEILQYVTNLTESCVHWAQLLKSLMEEESIRRIYALTHNVKMDPKLFSEIAQSLNDGKTILASILQTIGGDHAFAIEPLGDGKARILHGWQGYHPLRPEQSMPIKELCDTLKRLTKLDHVNDKRRLEKVLCKLFGKDHARLGDEAAVRRQFSFTAIFEGVPRESLTCPANRARLRGLSDVMAPPERALLSGSNVSSHNSGSNTVPLDDFAEAGGRGNKLSDVGMGIAVGAGLGFVFGAGGAWLSGEDWKDVGLAGLKAGLGEGVAGGVAAGAANAGASVFGSNVVAGIALFGVYAIWDVIEWQMDKITGEELRERLVENAGAAVGSIAGGAAVAAAVGGMCLVPEAAAVAAIIGGTAVGGFGGKYAAKSIDSAIRDAVMNSYEFFGWHDVDRNTIPKKTPKEIGDAYAEKLKNKPKQVKEKDWNNVCLGIFMFLSNAMYPVFQDLLKLANKMRQHNGNGLSAIATLVYEQSQIKEE